MLEGMERILSQEIWASDLALLSACTGLLTSLGPGFFIFQLKEFLNAEFHKTLEYLDFFPRQDLMKDRG